MSGSATMEGYLHKKGHTLPTMQRRYCVLKGTMLAYYSNADEYVRKLTPRNVLEVIGVRDIEDSVSSGGFLSPSKRKHAFEIEYLGGTTYQCNADSREEKQQWLSALHHALDEPNRIIQDEIEDAQRHLEDEAFKEEQAMVLANEAVGGAQQYADEAMQMDAEIKNCKSQQIELDKQLYNTRVLLEEAEKKTAQTKKALQRARAKAHEAVLQTEGYDDSKQEDDDEAYAPSVMSATPSTSSGLSADEMADRIARLAAQLEVDETHEATQRQLVASIEGQMKENARLLEEYKARAKWCAEEGRKLRDAAASNLQSAQSAKQLSRLRVSSWTSSSSHLDPLAEGYLLCKHPLKPSMHRRYCVLYGNTLCWYKDADDFNSNVESPSGVVHVAAVTEWTGKVGGMKTFPHAFAIATVEGKTLYCSAPIQQSAVTWETALHIGLTMPALSPHRAMQAKARRDSFDLLTVASSIGHQPGQRMPRRASLAHVAATETTTTKAGVRPSEAAKSKPPLSPQKAMREEGVAVGVEGYLVKKSALFPVMKKKYCVLHGLKLSIFDTHDQYAMSPKSKGDHEEVLVCGVSYWDGHGTLLQYHHGFQIHTVKHHMIQCSAANENEKAKWMTGIHEALLTFKDQLLSPTSQEERALTQTRAEILGKVSGTSTGETVDQEAPKARFRKTIEQYYVQHHPTKAHDVPMLLEKYAGRERALVTHLDRIYGTEMAQESEMQSLIATLEATTRSPKPVIRRVSSGVNSGLREFGKMTGYLKWTSMGKPPRSPTSATSPKGLSFSVLSVDKLVRYPSETAYETEPYNPIEAIQVLSVNELTPATSTGFAVNYHAVGVLDKPVSPTNNAPLTLQLEATSTEQKTLWMAKLRSGLGFAAASKAKSPVAEKTVEFAEGHAADTAAKEDDEKANESRALRIKLMEYYRVHNPRRIAEVDTLLHYFHGREQQLLVDLDATYGTSISTDSEYLQALPSAAKTAATTEDSTVSAALGATGDEAKGLLYESYVWVKHPTLGSGFRKCYCVVRNTHWSCFEDSRQAHAFFATHIQQPGKLTIAKPPLLSDTVVNLNYLNAKLHEMRVLSFEGQTNSAILLRADVDPLFHDWTRVLRQAADLQQQLASPVEDKDAEEKPSWWQALHGKLVAFYQVHHKDKVGEVTSLLRSFQGRERALLEEIDRIYSTQLAQDSEILALIPQPTEASAATASSDSTDAILMEGYLVKRGHLVPSMRKRYCVLVKNVLTYYLTHEDSRNGENAQPLGSFRVEIVSDWHGKTTTQTYEHGIELETHDGKTFFCAAFSSDEKTQWMRAFQIGIATARAEATASAASTTEEQEESEDVRAKRVQFREWLVEYYQQHNPRKIADLDLLLACYKGREIVMLEAMDAMYDTQLLQDTKLLELLPPLDAHTQALRKLEYDGPLERAAGGNSDAAWKHATPVYVAQKGLTLTFYASREGFKAGAAALTSASDRAVTVLAVKPLDTTTTGGSCRFAVETTDHVWMYFQAANALEKTHWLQLLQAALDGMLAKTILDGEREFLSQRSHGSSSAALMTGFLAIRMDFVQALADFQRQLQSVAGSSSPSKSPSSKSDFSGGVTSPMKECYVVLQNNNELVVFPDDDRSQPIATLTALSTCAWKAVGGLSPTSSSSATVGKFPFQVLTQEQVVLSCGAATDLDRAKWIQQIRLGAQQAAAIEMLQEQLEDVHAGDAEAQRPRRASVLDETSGDLKGYLYYRLGGNAKDKDEKEGFVVLTKRGGIRIFEDETAFLRRQIPVLDAQAVEIDFSETDEPVVSPGGHLSRLFSKSAKPTTQNQLSFELSVSIGDDTTSTGRQIVVFAPASQEERTLWTDAIVSGINICKGEQLLDDEKRVLAIEAAVRRESKEEEDEEQKEGCADDAFVFATSAMEGELIPWRNTSGASATIFAILDGCRLRGFPSRTVALANAASPSNSEQPSTASADIEISSVADWVPPGSDKELPETLGFQLTAMNQERNYCFTAPSLHAKRQWIHAIQHELDFALAEKYLDEDAKEFARLAAIHLAAAVVPAATGDSQDGRQTQAVRLEGYVRVRHQFVGSMWRERYAIIVGTSLWLFKDGGEAVADDWQQRAMERHELITADEWHVSTAAAASGSRDRFGLQLENQDGAMLELTFGGQEDRDAWLSVVKSSLERTLARSLEQEGGTATSRFISRDPALPFVPGAAMEGFLKVRHLASSKIKLLQRRKTRYAVLIGTQWLLYETQQQALALHGHNSSASGGEAKEESDDILPQAVLEVVLAEQWQISASKSSGSDDAETLELLSHGFRVVANKTSVYGGTISPSSASSKPRSGGDVYECKAHTSLERKRWLNAMEDQIATIEREQELVRRAMQQHSDKETAHNAVKTKFQTLKDDANRHSMYLKDVLESLQTETTSEEEEDESEESEIDTGDEELSLAIRSRSLSRIYSPENSPKYRSASTDVLARRATVARAFYRDDVDAPGSPSKRDGKSTKPRTPWYSLQTVFSCCFDRPPVSTAMAAVVPIKNPKYVYKSYHEDAPSRIEDL